MMENNEDLIIEKLELTRAAMDIPRRNMPQVAEKHYKEFLKFLKKQNVSASAKKISIKDTKRVQKEISKESVKRLMDLGKDGDKINKPIVVSSDSFILDGNHRAMAHYNLDKNSKIDAIVINIPAKEALKLMREFPKTVFKDASNKRFKDSGKLKMENVNFTDIVNSLNEARKKIKDDDKLSIRGFGMGTVKSAKESLPQYMKELEKQLKRGNYRGMLSVINNSGMKATLEALKEVQDKNGE